MQFISAWTIRRNNLIAFPTIIPHWFELLIKKNNFQSNNKTWLIKMKITNTGQIHCTNLCVFHSPLERQKANIPFLNTQTKHLCFLCQLAPYCPHINSTIFCVQTAFWQTLMRERRNACQIWITHKVIRKPAHNKCAHTLKQFVQVVPMRWDGGGRRRTANATAHRRECAWHARGFIEARQPLATIYS